MTKIVTVKEMQEIERTADQQGHSYHAMMEMAGHALADHIISVIMQHYLDTDVLVLVGPGNNGGDGLVAARLLTEHMPDVTVTAYILKPREASDEVYQAARTAGVTIIQASDDIEFTQLSDLLSEVSVIVDALFGTGTRPPIRGSAAELLAHVKDTLASRQATPSLLDPAQPLDYPDKAVVIAVDCPSGLDCDTGEVDTHTLYADSTVTFAAAKPGLFRFPGAAAVGHLRIGDIGLPSGLTALESITLELADGPRVKQSLPPRRLDSHKGTFGKTLIVAGSNRYIGAAFLAGAAAYAAGTGLVSIAPPENLVPTLAAMLPEAIWLPLPHENGMLNSEAVAILRESFPEYSALLVGPGLGHNRTTQGFLVNLLETIGLNTGDQAEMPRMVIDADGLNILATLENWWQRLPPRTIITPHPGEFSRLAAYDKENAPSIKEVQSDRVAVARRYAAIWNCVVVLKGPYTISAEPEGRTTVNPFASSALASAGTGDVLAGTIAGLLAQGMAAADAAIAGAWLHGYAGHYAEEVLGTPVAVKASDVLAYLANAFQALNSVTP